jgi:hypothetical protein
MVATGELVWGRYWDFALEAPSGGRRIGEWNAVFSNRARRSDAQVWKESRKSDFASARRVARWPIYAQRNALLDLLANDGFL